MHEEEQDDMIRRLANERLQPPPVPREEIWARIEAARQTAPSPKVLPLRSRRSPGRQTWLVPAGIAAMVLVAFGLGRITAGPSGTTPVAVAPAPRTSATTAHRVVAAEYLGRTEVFLTTFRAAARTGRPDTTAPAEARRLLGTARLLLDSKAADDVRIRALLEDLELVLAEIAQLPAPDKQDVDLITDGLDQRGTLGRLRSAVPAGGAPRSIQGVS